MAWGTSRVSGNMAYHAYFWLKRSVCQKIFDPFSQNSTWELGLLKTDLKSFANFFASSHQVNYLLLKKIYGKRNVRVVNNYAETTMTLRISMVNFWRPLTGFKEIFKRNEVLGYAYIPKDNNLHICKCKNSMSAYSDKGISNFAIEYLCENNQVRENSFSLLVFIWGLGSLLGNKYRSNIS